MNDEIFKALLDLADTMRGVFMLLLGLFIGYWMGRNSAERPFIQQTENVVVDQGSTDEPLHGDIFAEALTEEERPETEKGIPTIIGDERLP